LFSVTAFADLRRKGNPIVIFASDGDKLRRLAGCRHSGKPHFDFQDWQPGLIEQNGDAAHELSPDPHGQPTVIQVGHFTGQIAAIDQIAVDCSAARFEGAGSIGRAPSGQTPRK
jgi:hypothetical protein